jgi:hypothetical protein
MLLSVCNITCLVIQVMEVDSNTMEFNAMMNAFGALEMFKKSNSPILRARAKSEITVLEQPRGEKVPCYQLNSELGFSRRSIKLPSSLVGILAHNFHANYRALPSRLCQLERPLQIWQ